MFILMIVVFVLGYLMIALEHPIKIDKAASALLLGALIWVVYIMNVTEILSLGFSDAWEHFLHSTSLTDYTDKYPEATLLEQMKHFVINHEIIHHLGDISQILFFLLGAMTIVETIDQHQGF